MSRDVQATIAMGADEGATTRLVIYVPSESVRDLIKSGDLQIGTHVTLNIKEPS